MPSYTHLVARGRFVPVSGCREHESADPRPVDPLEAWAPADSGGDPFGWYRLGGLGAGDDLPAAEPSSDVSYLEPISTRARPST